MKAQLLSILNEHAGKENAIGVLAIAEKMQIHERLVRDLKSQLIEDGYLIGSSCDPKRNGYYMMTDEAEKRDTILNLQARAFSILRIVSKLQDPHAFSRFMADVGSQLKMGFLK